MDQRIGFLFPGQGAQYVGMGKDLADTYPQVREIFQTAQDDLGYSILDLCVKGPEDQLTRTLYAQPAIYTVSAAVLAVVRSKFPEIVPAFCAGLSLGEFSALHACGAIGFSDGLKLVRLRAEAMEFAAGKNPGTMASVIGLGQDDCEKISREAGCSLANLNAPDQFVLSGTAEAIDDACRRAEAAGAKRALRLKVGGAFHSPLMADAQSRLEQALSQTGIDCPKCLFIPNASAEPVSDPGQIRILLAKQLTSPVRWIETMKSADAAGIRRFVEIGPGKVLKGLAKRCCAGAEVFPCGTAVELEKLRETLQTLGV